MCEMYLGVAIYSTFLSEIASKCLISIFEILQATISVNLTHGGTWQITSIACIRDQIKCAWITSSKTKQKQSEYQFGKDC